MLVSRVPPRPLILCVEDDDTSLQLRKAVLERSGYAVIAATAIDEALQSLREAPVCLVLSDHMLRGATGIDLAMKMKQIKPGVPVVLYSGSPPEIMRGVDCFINKTESRTNFLAIIGDLIKRYCDA